MENKALIRQVLSASSGDASDMTHALCSLGNGDMGTGVTKLWSTGHKSGLAKGVSITSLVFTTGIGIGLYFLRRYHKEKVSQAEIEGIEDFISSGSAARYANGDTPKGEFSLGELSSDENWEVIVRRTPHKKCTDDTMSAE